jgi:hypothetical protein
VRPGERDRLLLPPDSRGFATPLPIDPVSAVPSAARRALVDAADRVLEGRSEVLGVPRIDLSVPDWFLDPVTGRRAPEGRYAFSINHRSEQETGNVKQVWELSRHHHLTVLSAAWSLSGEDRYAEVVARQLRDWWRDNPFLSGVHWTSGIEIGIRLISWVWIRRLLDRWPGAAELFEGNDEAARQVYRHQQYLSAFRSTGSSANNHVIAEAAGQLAASCAFPWFPESSRWREGAAALLERQLERNTFPSGVNRELASEYHGFVAELGLVAAVEAQAAGCALAEPTWRRLCRMVDVAAALVDERLRPPRQGDGDDGQVLVVDAPDRGRWSSLLAAGARLYGPLPWWPQTPPDDVRSTLLSGLAGAPRPVPGREQQRPSHFADAGLTVLRTPASEGPEIWCRCDGGPHGYLSIAAHAHADALSVEVRHAGVDVLADPGTYCYQGEREWRDYFRSTLAHNTLQLAGQDQSVAGGPFLWRQHAGSRVLRADVEPDDGTVSWSAQHDGYRRLHPPAVHRRTVQLDRRRRRLAIFDSVETGGLHPCRLAFHVGPSVRVALTGDDALLRWPAQTGEASATVCLPHQLRWTTHRGETEPILGWYSPAFGRKQPAVTLVGTGTCRPGVGALETVVQFDP